MYLEDYEDFEPDDEDLELDDDDGDLDELMEMLDDADYDDFEPDDEDLDDIERKRRFFKRRWKSKMRRSKSSFKRGRRKRTRFATVEQVEKGFRRSDRNDRVMGRRISSLKRSAAKFATRTARDHKKQQGEIDNIKQMTLLTSLLGGNKKLKVESVRDQAGDAITGADGLVGATIEFEDSSDTLDKFLPFLLLGGMGGGKGGGLGDNPLMTFLLIDSIGGNK